MKDLYSLILKSLVTSGLLKPSSTIDIFNCDGLLFLTSFGIIFGSVYSDDLITNRKKLLNTISIENKKFRSATPEHSNIDNIYASITLNNVTFIPNSKKLSFSHIPEVIVYLNHVISFFPIDLKNFKNYI